MGRKATQTAPLLSMPKDFEKREMDALSKPCGSGRNNRGKTSGSTIQYVHQATRKVFTYHRPYPGNIIKPYVLKAARKFLQGVGEIQ